MAADAPVLAVRDLCKAYGPLKAVDGVSFEVRPGEIVGLVGPNGAGKTTTINMVLGVLAPTSGEMSTASTSPAAAARRWPTPTSRPPTPPCPAT
jgi:ABC-type multidrug transport system ATPase subunit